jgi:hypothetical protein
MSAALDSATEPNLKTFPGNVSTDHHLRKIFVAKIV